MTKSTIDLSKKIGPKAIHDFVAFMQQISREIGFKVSSRGWGYIMEQKGIITKDQFDKIEDVINRARRKGLLPVDFIAEESARKFEGVDEWQPEDTLPEHVSKWLDAAINCDRYYSPEWWDGEEYYIQMVVEKIDLVSLFSEVTKDYHIPIANSKGWSSILQRAEYCKRFAEAEERGLKCVLLYCGDHDPDGLRISDTLRKNLEDIKDVIWTDGTPGYNPDDLIIERFGLDYEFIQRNRLTWIDNLITGSGANLANPSHPNYKLPYLQQYLNRIGVRKCEANALVIAPEEGRNLCREAIERYLGPDAPNRFEQRRRAVRVRIDDILERLEIRNDLDRAITRLQNWDENE
jgi:hypothetical protein